jgi:hypothetical protein
VPNCSLHPLVCGSRLNAAWFVSSRPDETACRRLPPPPSLTTAAARIRGGLTPRLVARLVLVPFSLGSQALRSGPGPPHHRWPSPNGMGPNRTFRLGPTCWCGCQERTSPTPHRYRRSTAELPVRAPQLPLPIPVSRWLWGKPDVGYPWNLVHIIGGSTECPLACCANRRP